MFKTIIYLLGYSVIIPFSLAILGLIRLDSFRLLLFLYSHSPSLTTIFLFTTVRVRCFCGSRRATRLFLESSLLNKMSCVYISASELDLPFLASWVPPFVFSCSWPLIWDGFLNCLWFFDSYAWLGTPSNIVFALGFTKALFSTIYPFRTF